MANLIAWLKFSGAHLVTGLPVASGFARFYVPGSDVAVDIFADDAETEPLTQPVTLDAAGRATVYCAEAADIVITTSTGAAVGTGDSANTVNAEQVRVVWDGSDSTLDLILPSIATSLAGGSYAIVASSAASPSFEFNPNVDTNVFRCSYVGEITAISVALPSPAPTIPVGKRFSIVFQFSITTTLDIASRIDFSSNIVENDADPLMISAYSHVWSADFQKTSGGKLYQITPWTVCPGDLWTV